MRNYLTIAAVAILASAPVRAGYEVKITVTSFGCQSVEDSRKLLNLLAENDTDAAELFALTPHRYCRVLEPSDRLFIENDFQDKELACTRLVGDPVCVWILRSNIRKP